MKKSLLILLTALLLSGSVATVATLATVREVQAASKIGLNKTKLTLVVGKTYTLKTKGTSKKATWKTSKKSIAAISAKKNASVKITAKKVGTSTITATINKKKYNCKVTVVNPKISKSKLSLTVGNTSTLKVTGGSGTVKWASANKKIATVSKTGKITAKTAGTVKITATQNGKKLTCTVTIKAKPTPTPTKKPTPKPTKKPTATPKPTKKPVATPKPTKKPTATPKPTQKPEKVPEASFKTEYYLQDIDKNTYTLSSSNTKTYNSTVGAYVPAYYDKHFEGFTFQREERSYAGNIQKNKQLVIKHYYSRNQYKLNVYTSLQGECNQTDFTCYKKANNLKVFYYPYGKKVKYQDLGLIQSTESIIGLHTQMYKFDTTISGSKLETTVTADDKAELNGGFRKLEQPRRLVYDEKESKKLFNMINAYRNQNGLHTLVWEGIYSGKIAMITAGSNVYNHVYGTGILDLSNHGSGNGHGGEGLPNADTAMDGWKNSPLHDAYLKFPYDKTGATAVYRYNDKYGNIWISIIYVGGANTEAELKANFTDAELTEAINQSTNGLGLNIPLNTWSRYLNPDVVIK